ncbi:MAG: N-acetyltransferase family protein [Syntrophomonadaceae bacterium]
MQIKFEKMGPEHQKSVMEILNYYIETSTAAFPATTLPEPFFAKLMENTDGYPAYVAINSETSEAAGFCKLRPYSPFSTFKATAVISYFISPGYVGQNIGGQFLERVSADAKQLGIKYIIAEISSENEPSLKFHAKHGFVNCGALKNIGSKFGRNFDVVLMQKDLKD